jgi:hypothetical protein
MDDESSTLTEDEIGFGDEPTDVVDDADGGDTDTTDDDADGSDTSDSDSDEDGTDAG